MSSNKAVEYLMGKGPMLLQWLDIDSVKDDPKNPKYITHEQLESLKTSIAAFPEMMLLRPGVVDAENVLIAGHQRKKACKALGWDKFPVYFAKDLTPDQVKEFQIKDNVQWGEWDHDILKDDWNISEVAGWGLELEEMPEINEAELPPTSQSRLSHQKQIRLNYTEDQYELVKKELAKIAETPELAVLYLLKLKKRPQTANPGSKNTHREAGRQGDRKDPRAPNEQKK